MRIRVWNAFASNNSGSYTIVGSFRDSDRASECAQELEVAVRAHTRWIAGQEGRPSPLDLLAEKHGVPREPGEYDEWPEYGGKDTPDVACIGHQVIIHHDYTVSLPRFLGHYLYARGGRVECELDHAHEPLITIASVWWPWDRAGKLDVGSRVTSIKKALEGQDGPLQRLSVEGVQPKYRVSSEFGDPPLRVATVFGDLVPACEELRRIVEPFEAEVQLKIVEAFSGEPLGILASGDGWVRG